MKTYKTDLFLIQLQLCCGCQVLLSIVGHGDEWLKMLGILCLCTRGQSHWDLCLQREVGSWRCHWERLGGRLCPRIYAITLAPLERPPAGETAGSIAGAISTSLYKSSTRAANRQCWIKSLLFPANQMAPQHMVPSFLNLIKHGWMRQWCHEICICLVHLTLPIMMMECFPHVWSSLGSWGEQGSRVKVGGGAS